MPIFFYQFVIAPRKFKNLPDIDEMPDLILSESETTPWEEGFCWDIKDKFAEKDFEENISRKQCRKLLEIYLERVRKVPEKEIDITKLPIILGNKRIQ